MIICFTGIDGSGKTLQAQRLVAQLNATGYPARYVWTGGRAYVTRPLIWLAKRVLRAPRLAARSSSREQGAEGQEVKGDQYNSYLSSTRRLFRQRWVGALWRQISLVEHVGEILAVTLPHLRRGRIVVCDRYIYDSLIGIAVLAGTPPEELAGAMRLPSIYPVPRPHAWFLIDVPAQVAFDRRTDVVGVEFLERRIPLYHAAAAALGAHVIDGNRAPELIAADVWRLLWEGQGGLALPEKNPSLIPS
jgi:thymidylate kinase